MTVIAAAVLTRSGKTLLSRQFIEISRPKIEGLLAAFPKLVGSSGKQHTYVETPLVRYLYQPMEDLYTVIITTRASNIVEDLETLQLLSSIVHDACGSVTEANVLAAAFELIFEFDEVIAIGYKEKVTLAQVKAFIEMDSHDEKIHEMVQKNREREALEEAKRRRKEIERERKQREKMGLPSYQGIGRGGSANGMGGGPGGMTGYSAQQPQILENRKAEPSYSPQPAAPAARKGLQLKKTAAKKDEYYEAMKQETGIDLSRAPDALKAATTENVASSMPATLKDDVHLEVIEKLFVQLDRDGNLQSMEVRGEFIITVRKQAFDTVAVKLKCPNRDVEFKAHPNMDKNRWASEQVLALRDPSRAYPLDVPTSVLKWRILSNDSRVLPLTVNCWPSTNLDTAVVSLEYELARAKPYTLRDVSIRVPVVGKSAPKITSAGEGTTDFDPRDSVLTWDIPVIDSSISSGSMEFEIAQWANARGESPNVFPIEVKFNTPNPLSDIGIEGAIVNGQAVKFSSQIALAVDKYTIQ